MFFAFISILPALVTLAKTFYAQSIDSPISSHKQLLKIGQKYEKLILGLQIFVMEFYNVVYRIISGTYCQCQITFFFNPFQYSTVFLDWCLKKEVPLRISKTTSLKRF